MNTIYRAAAILVLAFALSGSLSSCGHASGATTTGPGGTAGLSSLDSGGTAGSNSASNRSTSGGPVSGGSTNPPAAGYPSSAQAYTQAGIAAWTGGDTARVDQLRDPGATIFATLSGGNYDKHYTLKSCQGAAGSSNCTFFNNVGDELILRVSNPKLGQAHAITDGQFHPIAFPADMQAYAQECLDAWIAGNNARVGLLTTADAKTHLNATAGSHRSLSWTFQDSQGAAGSSYLTWHNPGGDRIVFRFYNPGMDPAEGPQHRIRDVLWNP